MKKFILFLVIVLTIYANTDKKNTTESGWRFGDKTIVKNKKEDIKSILKQILIVQKEQLEVQKKILAILQKQFNPKPEYITLPNGKKCIANSSAECFKMPITPAALRIPVLKNFLEKRDEKSAEEYIKWQSKYLSAIFDMGSAYKYAIENKGDQINNLGYENYATSFPMGYSSVLMSKAMPHIINKYADKFQLYIFLGLNSDLDIISIPEIIRLAKTLPNVKINLVLYDKKIEKAIKDYLKMFNLYKKYKNNFNFIVSKSSFKKFNIYTTPALTVKLQDNKIYKITMGKVAKSEAIKNLKDFLTYKKVIPRKEFTFYKLYQEFGDYAPFYMNHYFGISKGKIEKIKKIYQEEKK